MRPLSLLFPGFIPSSSTIIFPMLSRARKILFCVLLGGLLLLPPFAAPAIVSETEPNNDLQFPNSVQVGDTVYCAGLPQGDLDHFRFLAPGGDSLYLRTFPCNENRTDTWICLFDDNMNIITWDDDNGGPMEFSGVGIWVPHTAYYRLRVMRGSVHFDSTYSLFIDSRTPVPEDYDFCVTARVIHEFPYFDEGDTWGMMDNIGTDAPDVFYRFTQVVTSDVLFEVCSPSFDARVQIIGRCMGDYGDDESVGCLGADGLGQGATLVSYDLPPDEYWIVVEGIGEDESGEYTLEVRPYFPPCPTPRNVVVARIGGQPVLDWIDVPEADYYLIQQSSSLDAPFENLGISFESFYEDPAGFSADIRFYQVITICPWGH
jgi:hypothetical protein